MPPIRVLVTDDSVVVRRLLTTMLSADPDIEVVGAAAGGRIALARIPQVNPDVVTLDVEMPELDGLETLREIRKTYPKLPVIMFSALTERAADVTLRALSLGASDYVTKPMQITGSTAPIEHVRSQLIPKIKGLCAHLTANGVSRSVAPTPSWKPPKRAAVEGAKLAHSIDVVAIGCSTGGPNALNLVFDQLPGSLRVPIVMVQHMPPVFTKALADRLTKSSDVEVFEATAGQAIEPGKAYIAPGDHHLVVKGDWPRVTADLNQAPPENSCRPAVDVLFRSVVQVYGPHVLAVVLTGMGQDGLRGCELVREAGGQVIVQDEASSVVWGMPGFVARAGLAQAVVPIDQIAAEILRRVGASAPSSHSNLSTSARNA